MSDTNLEVPTMQTYALNALWLDSQVPTNMTGTGINTTQFNGIGTVTTNWAPNTGYWWCYPTADHRPIKLGMSEVEKLRTSAKRDAKLKKILEKFTDLIEVTVDFK